jgi:hypothetical protein
MQLEAAMIKIDNEHENDNDNDAIDSQERDDHFGCSPIVIDSSEDPGAICGFVLS